MKDRIAKFLKDENISSSKFADEIGVQRSSISHIIAGRNNPSLELIQKILNRFDSINPDWLILGKGEMYRTGKSATLFDQLTTGKKENNVKVNEVVVNKINTVGVESVKTENVSINNEQASENNNKEQIVEKMLIIYSNGTFETYTPSH